eukprot:m.769108 g.769108  ORF g.769108 m.769108 type:complete len:329 (+) comp23235_c0_seq5:157-1143(+)
MESDQNLITHVQVLDRCIAHPDSVAVFDTSGTTHSYGDLARRAGDVAACIGIARQTCGNNPTSSLQAAPVIVAVVLPRSFDLIAALLGVWISGRAVLIVDAAAQPIERIELMLRDCCVSHIVTNTDLRKRLTPIIARLNADSAPCPEIILVENNCITPTGGTDVIDGQAHRLRELCIVRGQNPTTTLAYVVYTSGSTGRPKGVMVAHLGLMNLCDYYRTERHVTAADCLSQTIAPGFDPIHEEIWPALTSGASLRIADEDTRLAPPLLAKWLATSGTTIALLPTPVAELVLQCPWPTDNSQSVFRLLICGGDVLKIQKPEHCRFTFVA